MTNFVTATTNVVTITSFGYEWGDQPVAMGPCTRTTNAAKVNTNGALFVEYRVEQRTSEGTATELTEQ